MDTTLGLSITLKLDDGFKEVSQQLSSLQDIMLKAQANDTKAILEALHRQHGSRRAQMQAWRNETPDCEELPSMDLAAAAPAGLAISSRKISRPSVESQFDARTAFDSRFLDSRGFGQKRFSLKVEWQACMSEEVDVVWNLRHSREDDQLVPKVEPRSCFTVHPQSPLRMVWDVVAMCYLIFDFVTIPLEPFGIKSGALVVLDRLSAIFWTLDMVASSITGIFIKGDLVMDVKRIMRQYAQTWLLLDLLIMLPEWLMLIINSHGTSTSAVHSLTLLRIVRVVRFVRLLRLVKAKHVLESIEGWMDSQLLLLTVTVVKLTAGLFFIVHFFACAWYAIGVSELGGWVTDADVESKPFVYRYVTSFQWAVQIFHPARPREAEMTEGTNFERGFELMGTMFGLVVSSLFISTLTNTMVTLQALFSKQAYHHRVIANFVHSHKICNESALLAQKQVHRQLQRADQQAEELQLTHLISIELLMDMREEYRCPVITWNPFLCTLHHRHPRLVRRLCHEAFQEVIVYNNEHIFRPKDAGDRMYFVDSGYLIFAPEDSLASTGGRTHTRSLGPGAWISEAVLWVVHWEHLGELMGHESVSVLQALVSPVFVKVVAQFPQAHIETKDYAVQFLRHINSPDVNDLELVEMPGDVAAPAAPSHEKSASSKPPTEMYGVLSNQSAGEGRPTPDYLEYASEPQAVEEVENPDLSRKFQSSL